MEKQTKRTSLFALAALMLAVLPVLSTCSPKVSQPQTEQAADSLSFEAAEYSNAEYGVSIRYPVEWQVQPSHSPTTVFYAAASRKVPLVNIFAVSGTDIAEAFTTAVSDDGSDIQLISEKPAQLRDGTPAVETTFKWKAQGMGTQTLALGVKKRDRWIIVAVTTAPLLARYDEALFSEIVYTLKFTK